MCSYPKARLVLNTTKKSSISVARVVAAVREVTGAKGVGLLELIPERKRERERGVRNKCKGVRNNLHMPAPFPTLTLELCQTHNICLRPGINVLPFLITDSYPYLIL